MRKSTTFGLATIAGLFVASSATAGVVMFDLRGGTTDWDAALLNAGKTLKASWDFGTLPDFGLLDGDEPLDWRGSRGNAAGRVPEGFLPTNVRFQSNLDQWGANGENPGGERGGAQPLVFVGPSQGFGNTKNWLGSNFAADSFDIVFDGGTKTAVDLVVSTIFATSTDVSVYGANNELLMRVTLAGTANAGYRVGFLATEGSIISRINIDTTSQALYEGVQGMMNVYEGVIPAPGALALLGVAGLASRRRRRA